MSEKRKTVTVTEDLAMTVKSSFCRGIHLR